MTETVSTERLELALHRCSGPLNAAADELSESGYVEAGSAIRTLAEGRDLHETAARSWLDLAGLDQPTRDLAINAVADVARVMIENGEDKEPAVLLTWLEEVCGVYGFPGDRADARAG